MPMNKMVGWWQGWRTKKKRNREGKGGEGKEEGVRYYYSGPHGWVGEWNRIN